MIFENINLIGKKAFIIPLQEKHLYELSEAGKFPEIWEHLQINLSTIDIMKNFIDESLINKEKGKELPFVIIDRSINKIVGFTKFLDLNLTHRGLEIGYTWFTPSAWSTGINCESKYLLLKYCFEGLKMIRVQFRTNHLNIRSQKAILKLGATYEGSFRNHSIRKDETYRDTLYYSITIEDWKEVKNNLEKKLNYQ